MLPPTKLFCTVRLTEFLLGVYSFLFLIYRGELRELKIVKDHLLLLLLLQEEMQFCRKKELVTLTLDELFV